MLTKVLAHSRANDSHAGGHDHFQMPFLSCDPSKRQVRRIEREGVGGFGGLGASAIRPPPPFGATFLPPRGERRGRPQKGAEKGGDGSDVPAGGPGWTRKTGAGMLAGGRWPERRNGHRRGPGPSRSGSRPGGLAPSPPSPRSWQRVHPMPS